MTIELLARIELLEKENQKLKDKNTIYKSTIKGQYNKIKELQNAKRISKKVHKERKRKLQDEIEKLNHYKLLYQKVKERNDKAIEYINKNKRIYDVDGTKENMLDEFNILASPKRLLEILKGNNEK